MNKALLAPVGILRTAINLGNPVLTKRVEGSDPIGVSVDLARAFAARLGLPLQLVPFDTAGLVVEALGRGEIDLAFLAIEPTRATEIRFSAPYVRIEGTYMVREGSPLREIADFDREGVRISVATKAAYDLFLTRTIQHATLVRAATPEVSFEDFIDNRLEAAAGIRQALVSFAATRPGLRVCAGRFMAIEQAMAIPREREAAAGVVEAFIAEMKAGGFVRRALEAHGQHGAEVAL